MSSLQSQSAPSTGWVVRTAAVRTARPNPRMRRNPSQQTIWCGQTSSPEGALTSQGLPAITPCVLTTQTRSPKMTLLHTIHTAPQARGEQQGVHATRRALWCCHQACAAHECVPWTMPWDQTAAIADRRPRGRKESVRGLTGDYTDAQTAVSRSQCGRH